jgi:hypothetical protein
MMFAFAFPDSLLGGLHHILFVGTVLLTLVAFGGALRCRAGFGPDDLGRRTWTFFAAFLGIRILAELRLFTIYFDLVPELSNAGRVFYIVVLRYLYTLSDLMMIAGLVSTIRGYRGLGLHFAVQRRDEIGIAVLAVLPIAAFVLRDHLTVFVTARDDQAILVYRLVAVTVTAVVAALCIVILRYVRQMGGGALARVWGAVVVAGLARAASFVALAAVTSVSSAWGDVVEQTLLLVFAAAWLTAAGLQRRLIAA